MPDIIDEILDKLSPESLEMLDKIDLESDRESRRFSEDVQKSLTDVENIYLKRCIREMDNRTALLSRETRKYKSLLDKYSEELEKIRCAENHSDHTKNIKKYSEQIITLEKQLSKLTKKSDPVELFVEINDMYEKIEELESKKKELEEAVKCYEGFPANMREAQNCISDLKERIKKKEALLK